MANVRTSITLLDLSNTEFLAVVKIFNTFTPKVFISCIATSGDVEIQDISIKGRTIAESNASKIHLSSEIVSKTFQVKVV